ncbi:MAG TPA: TetR/AcrR family transcriptional regulator [Solirubrobacteraceae bacterium]|nr:TetR/AcrR family transcriptional regulator [Solirubrobacteraceae bacterium]
MPAATSARAPSGGRGARARIITAALRLFRAQGINATGVAELTAVAHVSKRTLYQHFPSKDDVTVAYLRAFELDPGLCAEGALSRADLTPRARLLELFTALAAQPRPLRGCPFATAAAEFPDPAHPAHRFAAGHKQRFTEQLIDLAQQAGARPAEPIGRRLALLYDGAAAQSAALDSPEPAGEAFAVAAALLDAAID